MPANRKLRIFRIRDGVRIPYTLELDHEFTVVAEYADTTAIDHVAIGRSDRVQDMSPERKKAHTMARWSTPAVDVNPIPGTEELREEYFAERKKLDAQHGGTCPSCKQGALIRAYRDKLAKGGWL